MTLANLMRFFLVLNSLMLPTPIILLTPINRRPPYSFIGMRLSVRGVDQRSFPRLPSCGFVLDPSRFPTLYSALEKQLYLVTCH